MVPSAYQKLLETLSSAGVQLLAVSKTKSVGEIRALYEWGQRDFGENYVQEMVAKQTELPGDIRWHFIGHLQSNKVRYISPFVFMIQSVDSLKLLLEIDKQAEKNQRIIDCLLQIHIAREETKFGLDEKELEALLDSVTSYRSTGKLIHTRISGCMGMATMTGDQQTIQREFATLRSLFEKTKSFLPADPVVTLSMGMSNDYQIAIACGSTMVRIGSLIFGERKSAYK
jgi:pyridoxal phosphate enzyme (YggS family)